MIKADDTVACMGLNPGLVPPAGMGAVKEITAGEGFGCAIKMDDTVACWGFNGSGQTSVPASVTTVKQISAGQEHVCVIRTDDTVGCWGQSALGRTSPGVIQAKDVSAGYQGSCAVLMDDSVHCFGMNNPPARVGPVKRVSVGGMGDLDNPYDGNNFACAIRTDDTVACWGSDDATEVVHVIGQIEVPLESSSYRPSGTIVTERRQVSGASFQVEFTSAQVVTPVGTFSAADAGIRYAFDCGAGFGGFSASTSATCTAGTPGYHTVRGKLRDHDGGTREYSVQITVAPAAPASVVATAESANSIRVDWSDVADESRYVISRRQYDGTSWGSYSLIQEVAADVTTYTSDALAPATRYQFKVEACAAIPACSATAGLKVRTRRGS